MVRGPGHCECGSHTNYRNKMMKKEGELLTRSVQRLKVSSTAAS